MERIEIALKMIKEEFEKEYGKDSKLEIEDSIVGVFNDGVIIVTMRENGLAVEIQAGEPYKFNYNLDLVEKED